MLNIAATKEVFKNDDISSFGLIHSRDNIADGVTKRMLQASIKILFMKN